MNSVHTNEQNTQCGSMQINCALQNNLIKGLTGVSQIAIKIYENLLERQLLFSVDNFQSRELMNIVCLENVFRNEFL